MKFRIIYGVDPDPGPHGFYWPTSPSKRREIMSVRRNHPAVFESVYQCRPGRREGVIFIEEDFRYYQPPKNLALGISDPEVAKFCAQFYAIAAGWDTAMEAESDSNHTVGMIAGLLPCSQYHRGEDSLIYGECEPHLDVYMLDRTRKKLRFGDLVAEFRSMHQKWNPNPHVVEKKGSGIQLYQSMPAVGIHVEGVSSNESKRARAINGVEAGSTQGWFKQWRVHLPHGAEWVPDYKTEMKDFTGEGDSDDDQVDATVHLTNYAIQTGTSMALTSSDWQPENVDEIMDRQESLPEITSAYVSTPRFELLSWIQLAPEYASDPFADTCHKCGTQMIDGQPTGYCRRWQRSVVALDTCEHFAPVGELVQ